MLKSQEMRKLAPEMDPLRMGMGWKAADLSKPQIMVESSYGDSHPGSAHLNIFVEEAVRIKLFIWDNSCLFPCIKLSDLF